MKKIAFAICLLGIEVVMAQKVTEPAVPYLLDTAQLNHLHLYMEALREKSVGNNLEALKLWNEYLTIDSKNASAYFEASRIEDEISNFPEAIAKAGQAYNLDKNNKFYRENYMNLLTKNGKIEDAIRVLKEVIDSKKADDITKMQYAYLLSLSDNPKKAIAILSEFEKNGEYNEAIAYEKIKIYINQKDFKNAELELKKMIQNNPNDIRYIVNLAEFYLKTNQLELAEKTYNDILSIEPNNIHALLYKAEYYTVKKDADNYRKVLNSLINNKELNLETKLSLIANKYARGEKIDSLEKKYLLGLGMSMVSQYPNEFKVHQIMGDIFYMDRNYEGAKHAYKKALSLDNKEYELWQNFFFSLSALRQFQELADSTEVALDMFPANGMIHFYNALANAQIKKNDKAEKSFKRALKFIGENKDLEAQIYSSLGEIYHLQKKYKEMDESFESAIQLDPNNAFTLNNFAYYLSLRKDKLDYAKVMSKKSLDIDGKNSSFLDTYAWINFQLGNFEEAKKYQEKALENGKEDMSTIYEHYGDILIKLNDSQNALIYWNKAKEAGSTNLSLPLKISSMKYIDYQD